MGFSLYSLHTFHFWPLLVCHRLPVHPLEEPWFFWSFQILSLFSFKNSYNCHCLTPWPVCAGRVLYLSYSPGPFLLCLKHLSAPFMDSSFTLPVAEPGVSLPFASSCLRALGPPTTTYSTSTACTCLSSHSCTPTDNSKAPSIQCHWPQNSWLSAPLHLGIWARNWLVCTISISIC